MKYNEVIEDGVKNAAFLLIHANALFADFVCGCRPFHLTIFHCVSVTTLTVTRPSDVGWYDS